MWLLHILYVFVCIPRGAWCQVRSDECVGRDPSHVTDRIILGETLCSFLDLSYIIYRETLSNQIWLVKMCLLSFSNWILVTSKAGLFVWFCNLTSIFLLKIDCVSFVPCLFHICGVGVWWYVLSLYVFREWM